MAVHAREEPASWSAMRTTPVTQVKIVCGVKGPGRALRLLLRSSERSFDVFEEAVDLRTHPMRC